MESACAYRESFITSYRRQQEPRTYNPIVYFRYVEANNHTRRAFLKNAVRAGTAVAVSAYVPSMSAEIAVTNHTKADPTVFLFQGDSITDGNRGRDNDPNHIMGHGYAFSIASRAGARFPERGLTFYNRGISGNTVPDLLTRWPKDALDLKPDVLSILVGVNDSERALKQKDATATETFEDGYRTLLNQTKVQLPHCLLVLCEPFIAPVGRVKEAWTNWQREVQEKQEVVRQIANEYHAVFVPLQDVFNNAARRAPASYWIWDGIHPTVAGHELITQQWLKQVSKHLPFLKRIR